MNPFSLTGRRILITGASSGIGRATAVLCAQMGACLVITGRSKPELQRTYEQLEGINHVMISVDLLTGGG